MMSCAKIKDITSEVQDAHYIVVGDIHGCFDELQTLLQLCEFDRNKDFLICVGDLVDRGPKTIEVLEFCSSLPHFYSCMGNHDHKLLRHIKGSNVKLAHGLSETIKKLQEKYGDTYREKYFNFFLSLPHIIKLHDFYVVHAGFDPLQPPENQFESDCIYMRYYGGDSFFDSINGLMWYDMLPNDYPKVMFGHEVHLDRWKVKDSIFALDGGCCFGYELRAYDSKLGIVSTPALKAYSGAEAKIN